MKSVKRFTKVLSVGLLAMGAFLSSSPARAGSDHKLTLPVEARFGKAILPPGDYTLVIDSKSVEPLVYLRGDHKSVMALPVYAEAAGPSTEDQLTLVKNGDGYAVSAIRVASLGLTFHYAASQPEMNQSARAEKANQQDSASAAKD